MIWHDIFRKWRGDQAKHTFLTVPFSDETRFGGSVKASITPNSNNCLRGHDECRRRPGGCQWLRRDSHLLHAEFYEEDENGGYIIFANRRSRIPLTLGLSQVLGYGIASATAELVQLSPSPNG